MKYEKFVLPQFNGESLPLLIHQQFHNHSIFANTKDLAKYTDNMKELGVIHWSLFPRKLFVWLMIQTKKPNFYRRAPMYLEYSEEGLPWRI